MCFDIWATKTKLCVLSYYVPKCQMSSGPYGPFYHKITKNLIPQKDFTYFVPYAKGVTLFEVLPCYKFHEVASLNFRGKKLPTEISQSH